VREVSRSQADEGTGNYWALRAYHGELLRHIEVAEAPAGPIAPRRRPNLVVVSCRVSERVVLPEANITVRVFSVGGACNPRPVAASFTVGR
jgi:hypothetical protein